jgi:two-component system response regulator MprA
MLGFPVAPEKRHHPKGGQYRISHSIGGAILATILVIDDVEEIRDGIEKLLRTDGYSVDATRTEERAVECAKRSPPKLILLNLGKRRNEIVETARRIRGRAQLDDSVPIVLFCIEDVAEGKEFDLGDNTYAVHPDNFNQLRAFIAQLLEHGLPSS